MNMPVQMQGTCIRTSHSEKAHHTDTILEIIKMLGRQERSSKSTESVGPLFMRAPGLYWDCHIAMLLYQDQLQDLVNKVRMVSAAQMNNDD